MDGGILPPETLAALGLVRQPFAHPAGANAAPYSDPALDMSLNVLLEHLKDRSHPVLLKGEAGVGKTTLLRKLQARAPAEAHLCLIEGGPDISLAAVDYSVRLQWQPRPEHGDPRKLTLDRYLMALIEGGLQPALVIDDAHRLDPQVLAGLFVLKQRLLNDYGQALGLVLAGEPQIETTLGGFADRVPMVGKLHTIALRPFNREQTRAYLVHRLRQAGCSRPEVFDEATLQRIQQQTGGLPAQINVVAADELSAHTPVNKTGSGSGWVPRLLLPATAVVVIIGLGLAAYGLISGPFSRKPSPETTPPESPIPLAVPPPTAPPATAPSATLAEPMSPAPPERHDTPVAPLVEEHSTPPASTTAESQEPAVPVSLPPPTIQTLEQAGEPPAPTDTAPPSPPRTQASASKPTTTPPRQELADAFWILQQPPEDYTVQVLGVTTEEAVHRFHHTHRVDAPMAFYHAPRDGHDWYVVIVGLYATPEAAREAIRHFPSNIRENQPWIRRMGDVQLTILTARESGNTRP